MFQIVGEKEDGASVFTRCCGEHVKNSLHICLATPLTDPVISFMRKEDQHWIPLEGMASVLLGKKEVVALSDRSRFQMRVGVEVLCHVCEMSATHTEARFTFWVFVGGTSSGEWIHCCGRHIGEALGLCAATHLKNPRVMYMDLGQQDARYAALEHLNAARLLAHCFRLVPSTQSRRESVSTKPVIFIDVYGGQDNPAARAIEAVAFDTRIGDHLVAEGDVEVDIAVTDSVATALRMVNETEKTTIVLIYFSQQEKDGMTAFASRFSNRVEAVSGIGGDDQIAFVPRFLQLIAEKTTGGER